MLGTIIGLLILIGVESHEITPHQMASSLPEERLGLACPIELNYGPHCICDYWPYETYNIYCNASSPAELETIKKTFEQTPIVDHYEVRISLTASMSIPGHIFSNKTAGLISFECRGDGTKLGAIDPQAFIASAGRTSSFQIMSCDLTEFDFVFLAQLRVLETMRIADCTLTTMARMPLMPHMRMIELYAPTGLREWHDPAQTPFLDTIIINAATDTDQDTMETIVDTLLYYTGSLTRLYLVNLGLTRIPPAARNFTNLNTLDFSENQISTLPSGSLAFTSTLNSLGLANMPIQNIEPDAFQGNYRAAMVYMVFGKLIAFPRETFEELLEQMIQASGSIDIYGNPIVCDDCHLGWLINEKRHLLTRVSGTCANGTMFDQLDSQAYDTRCQKSAALFTEASSFLVILVLLFHFLIAQNK
ncbi:uncharacterized protein LOC130696697 [Daphnia carinata]|uniref:uncharacterized protein LOC130696697 n=1 Tax=Daphnia carinata TaxID=120202 RepID=UPI002580DE31|nr:uncharacterized protein LOC130696697 [Daphnia carinata]